MYETEHPLNPENLEQLTSSRFTQPCYPEDQIQFSSSNKSILCYRHSSSSYVIQSVDGGEPLASGSLPEKDDSSLVLNPARLERISNLSRPIVDWTIFRLEEAPNNSWFCIRTPHPDRRVLVQKQQTQTMDQVRSIDIKMRNTKRLITSSDGQWGAAWAAQKLVVFPILGEKTGSQRQEFSFTQGEISDTVFLVDEFAVIVVAGNVLSKVSLDDGKQSTLAEVPGVKRIFQSSNSQIILSKVDGTVAISNLAAISSGRSIRAQRSGTATAVSDSQSQWLVTGGSELAIRRWNYLAGTPDAIVRVESPAAENRLFESHKLLCCRMLNGSISLFRWPKLEPVGRIQPKGLRTLDFQLSEDGRRLFLANEKQVILYDVETGSELLTIFNFEKDITDARILSSGRYVAALDASGNVTVHQFYE
ncbi:MAG: hypothetical protein U0930_24880 [Pirellulales bacterium]